MIFAPCAFQLCLSPSVFCISGAVIDPVKPRKYGMVLLIQLVFLMSQAFATERCPTVLIAECGSNTNISNANDQAVHCSMPSYTLFRVRCVSTGVVGRNEPKGVENSLKKRLKYVYSGRTTLFCDAESRSGGISTQDTLFRQRPLSTKDLHKSSR